jgi:hypothetical protein
MSIIKEGAHFKYEGDEPVAVIISNDKIRVPRVYRLEQASADEIADLMDTKKIYATKEA